MSYRCDKCGNTHFGKMLKLVVEIRPVAYESYFNRFNRETREVEKVFVEQFKGKEIAKEAAFCSSCFNANAIPVEDPNIKIVDFQLPRRAKPKTAKELAQEKIKEKARRKKDKSKSRRPISDNDKDIG